MNTKEKIASFLLLGLTIFPSFAFASPVINGRDTEGNLSAIKTTIKLNKQEQKQASQLAKQTNLSRDKIAELINKGYTEEDIKTACTVRFFVKDNLDKIFVSYDEVERKQDKLLGKYKISQEDYQKQYEKLFKSDEDGTKTMRDNVPWRRAPF